MASWPVNPKHPLSLFGVNMCSRFIDKLGRTVCCYKEKEGCVWGGDTLKVITRGCHRGCYRGSCLTTPPHTVRHRVFLFCWWWVIPRRQTITKRRRRRLWRPSPTKPSAQPSSHEPLLTHAPTHPLSHLHTVTSLHRPTQQLPYGWTGCVWGNWWWLTVGCTALLMHIKLD